MTTTPDSTVTSASANVAGCACCNCGDCRCVADCRCCKCGTCTCGDKTGG